MANHGQHQRNGVNRVADDTQLQEAVMQIQSLQQLVDQLLAEQSSNAQQLEQRVAQVTELQAQLNAATADPADARGAADAAANEQLRQVTKKYRAAAAAKKAADGLNAALQERLDAANRTINELRSDAGPDPAAAAAAAAAVAVAAEETARAAAAAETMRTELAAARAEAVTAAEAREVAAAARTKLQAERRRATAARQEAAQEAANGRQDAETARSKAAAAVQARDAARADAAAAAQQQDVEVNDLCAEVARLICANEALQSSHDALESQLEEQKATAAQLRAQPADLGSRERAVIRGGSGSSAQRDAGEVSVLRAALADAAALLAEARAQHAAVVAELEAIQQQLLQQQQQQRTERTAEEQQQPQQQGWVGRFMGWPPSRKRQRRE